MHISIEITPEQHRWLQERAALSRTTLEAYVLARALPETEAMAEEEALEKLEAFLAPRVEAAKRGEILTQSVSDIIRELKRERHAPL